MPVPLLAGLQEIWVQKFGDRRQVGSRYSLPRSTLASSPAIGKIAAPEITKGPTETARVKCHAHLCTARRYFGFRHTDNTNSQQIVHLRVSHKALQGIAAIISTLQIHFAEFRPFSFFFFFTSVYRPTHSA